ncbi:MULTISPECIES: GNAT family N-acetyltransferase [unclassified Streptomyces]|uniref:GNAT family N-acetyltransferase n=1 Tax=unclassified Streptomyces TaxID=2593676 RepID=UPI00336A5A1E
MRPGIRMVEVRAGDDALLTRVYRDLLLPHFPSNELESFDELRSGLEKDLRLVTAVVNEDGLPMAVAVGDWSPESGVLLLAYLAVRAEARSGGLGSLLVEEVNTGWQRRLRPLLTLTELEHPLAHESDEVYGDPVARLRFYARCGGRALDVPYFQPALGSGMDRVYGMLLVMLSGSADVGGRSGATIPPGPVQEFVERYFLDTEGEVPADPPARQLRQAMERPGGIPLLPLTDVRRLPLSVPG